MSKVDVSIVLNAHDDAKYLRRTTLSIEESIRYAALHELTCEIVIVVDAGTENTRHWVENFDSDVAPIKKLFVENRSVGLSRQQGFEAADGTYSFSVDGDDLISFNYVSALHSIANTSKDTISYPAVMYGFGFKYYICKLLALSEVSWLALIEHNPFGNGYMARTELLRETGFVEPDRSLGYAYEDWHHICELVAKGAKIEVADHAVLFYRQGASRRNRIANAQSSRVTEFSTLFAPKIYQKIYAEHLKAGKPFGTKTSQQRKHKGGPVQARWLPHNLPRSQQHRSSH